MAAEGGWGKTENSTDRIWQCWIADKIKIRRRALRFTNGNIDEAEELISATLVRMAEHLNRSDITVQKPIAFFMTALRNEFISRYRRLSFETRLRDMHIDIHDGEFGLSDRNPSPEEYCISQEAYHDIMKAISNLSPSNQLLFVLRFREERPYAEIAKLLRISEALVRKRIQILRAKLRKHTAASMTDSLQPD